VRNASVFLLRTILHDWPTPVSRTILQHLREAATEDTKLVVGDFILSYACATQDDQKHTHIKGIELDGRSEVPYPLLPNMGKASSLGYSYDIMVWGEAFATVTIT
jgi:hypothetical protein